MTLDERIEERAAKEETLVRISDEHIQKLQLEEDSVLLIRVPIELAIHQGQQIMDVIRQVVQKQTGQDPEILMVARDCELSSLNIEALQVLRAEIDATLQYKFAQHGGDGGN